VFGDGTLKSGVSADGSGVTVTYLTACASQTATSTSSSLGSKPTSSSTLSSPSSASSPAQSSVVAHPVQTLNTATTHKVFAPLSVAVLMIAVMGARLSTSTATSTVQGGKVLLRAAALGAVAAYAIGIVGLTTSFTSISSHTTLAKRASSTRPVLSTSHGKAGFVLAVLLYGLIPLLGLLVLCRGLSRPRDHSQDEEPEEGREDDQRPRVDSVSTTEKLNGRPASRLTSSTVGFSSRPDSPRRMPSNGTSTQQWPSVASRDRRVSSSDGGETSHGRSFEVVNRPRNGRRVSEIAHNSDQLYPPVMPRSLSDVSWLQRRRSVNAVVCLFHAVVLLKFADGAYTFSRVSLTMRWHSLTDLQILQLPRLLST
jgi:hypothetical protein